MGQYREAAEPDTVYSIFLSSGTLFLEAPRLARTPLVPRGGQQFSADSMGAQFAMQLNANGSVAGWHRVQEVRAAMR